ncbi:MAG: ABC transporter permease [Reichenbachiella sp.]
MKKEYLEEIEGDMEEVFQDNLEFLSERKAKQVYTKEVFKLLRPILLKNLEEKYQLTQYGMVKNYIKVAFRILKKEKAFAFINVMGLALAIACSLLIYLWVNDEVEYNNFLTSGDRVCYVYKIESQTNGEVDTYQSTPYPLKNVIREKYPAIEESMIMSWGQWKSFQKEESLLQFEGIYASPEIFEMFEMHFEKGDGSPMKDKIESIAISASFAKKMYGEDWKSSDIIGQNITTEYKEVFELVGVFEDLPKRSTLKFDFVMTFEGNLKKNQWLNKWGNSGSRTYVKLAQGVDLNEAQLSVKNAVKDNSDIDWAQYNELLLQPFERNYLYDRFEMGKEAGGKIEYIRLLSIGAVLILVLASINFMNLSTARSSKRSKETGVRKVLGAFKSNLRAQHLIESLMITFFSSIVAFGLILIFLPYFNDLMEKEISLSFLKGDFLIGIFVFIVFLGLFSGAYPAFYLSSLKTVVSLKGGHKLSSVNLFFRKGLVIFQFMITIIMITGAIVVYQQVQYIQTKNIGFERSNLIRSWATNMSKSKDYPVIKTELLNRPGIASITTTNQNLISIGNSTNDPTWDEKGADEQLEFYVMKSNPDLLPTMEMKLLLGRNFSWEMSNDTANFIINESAQKLMQMTDPIGKNLEMWDKKGKVIGVIEDFHNASLHEQIEPLIILYGEEDLWYLFTRTQPGKTKEALASLEEVFKMYNPKREFQYDFMDDIYSRNYKSELMVKDLSLFFTVLAIIISCLGLFALVAYTAEQRTKEIGIRKVLGASISNILQLLSTEFLILLTISMIIAIPTAYYVMSGWLDGFAYRIELTWYLFGLASISTVVIAYTIIGSHAVRSAMANPVDSLRNE